MEKIPGSSKHLQGGMEREGVPKWENRVTWFPPQRSLSIGHKNPNLGYGNDQFPYYSALSFTQVP